MFNAPPFLLSCVCLLFFFVYDLSFLAGARLEQTYKGWIVPRILCWISFILWEHWVNNVIVLVCSEALWFEYAEKVIGNIGFDLVNVDFPGRWGPGIDRSTAYQFNKTLEHIVRWKNRGRERKVQPEMSCKLPTSCWLLDISIVDLCKWRFQKIKSYSASSLYKIVTIPIPTPWPVWVYSTTHLVCGWPNALQRSIYRSTRLGHL